MAAPDPSKLDLQQILQRVYDEAQGKLRTDATASIGDVTIAVDLDPTNDGVFIADKDTGNKFKVNTDGSIDVVITNSSVSTIPYIQNIPILLANVENTIVLPVSTKQFELRVRDAKSKIQITYSIGDSNSNYITIPRGCNYSETDLNLTTLNRVLYVRSAKDSIVIECMVWG